MSTPYGVQGCRCDMEFTWDDREEVWYPNAHCPYHGLLPRDRMETGTYRVVTTEAPSTVPASLLPGSFTCLFPRCDWEYRYSSDVDRVAEFVEHVRREHTTEQEKDDRPGILAAIRRRWRNRCWEQSWWF